MFNTEIETPDIGSIIEHDDLPPLLHEILPKSYTYYFQNIQIAKNGSGNSACSATFLTNATTQASATQWIGDFQEQTKTTYRITRGVQPKGKRVLYKTIRHCQHKRKPSKRMLKRPDSIRNKKTECTSTFTLKICNAASKPIYHTHPCEIHLTWDHNHSLQCAKALSFRPSSAQAITTFHSYYEQGHSPSSALHLHQLNMSLRYDDREGELELARADRSINPQYGDVFYLYRKWRIKKHGERNGDAMFGKLEAVINEYNTQYGPEGGKAFLQRFEARVDGKSQEWDDKPGEGVDTPLVLAICTPLMARAHVLLQQAGELVHCDSTASLDRCNCPTFIMSTACSAGGIPVGVVITSGEAEVTLKESFSYLRAIMPSNALMAHRCLLQMGVMQKKMPLKQYGLNQISFYVYFITCNVGGNGYGMPRMELILLTDKQLCKVFVF